MNLNWFYRHQKSLGFLSSKSSVLTKKLFQNLFSTCCKYYNRNSSLKNDLLTEDYGKQTLFSLFFLHKDKWTTIARSVQKLPSPHLQFMSWRVKSLKDDNHMSSQDWRTKIKDDFHQDFYVVLLKLHFLVLPLLHVLSHLKIK